jgi:hypothetical protein
MQLSTNQTARQLDDYLANQLTNQSAHWMPEILVANKVMTRPTNWLERATNKQTLMTIYFNQFHWASGLCPSTSIPTENNSVSETLCCVRNTRQQAMSINPALLNETKRSAGHVTFVFIIVDQRRCYSALLLSPVHPLVLLQFVVARYGFPSNFLTYSVTLISILPPLPFHEHPYFTQHKRYIHLEI